MIFNILIIIVLGIIMKYTFKKIKLPPLIGYLLVGIFLGPFGINIIKDSLIENSQSFRSVALVIILIRAGLSLDIKKFREMGLPVILLSFLPALMEVIIVGLISPMIFNIPYLDAFILGAVVASVSPAVIIPGMLKMVEEEHGTCRLIPQTIIAGSSLDDIIVLAIFTVLLGFKTSGNIEALSIIKIPLELILALVVGFILAKILKVINDKFKINSYINISIIFITSLSLYFFEEVFFINGLIAILTFTIMYKFNIYDVSKEEIGFKKLWFIGEILLFSIVGIGLDINNFLENIWKSILILLIALTFRVLGTYISLIKSRYSNKEKLFIVFSYLPKATVQAAIGSLALEAGVSSGNIILSVSIAAILITAPIGAILIDRTKDILIDRKQA